MKINELRISIERCKPCQVCPSCDDEGNCPYQEQGECEEFNAWYEVWEGLQAPLKPFPLYEENQPKIDTAVKKARRKLEDKIRKDEELLLSFLKLASIQINIGEEFQK